MPRKSRRVKSEGVADPLATQEEDQAALDAGEVRVAVGVHKMCHVCLMKPTLVDAQRSALFFVIGSMECSNARGNNFLWYT